MQGNMKAFAKDIEQWAWELVNANDTFVTEDGDIEDWNNDNSSFKKNILNNLKDYLKHLNTHIE